MERSPPGDPTQRAYVLRCWQEQSAGSSQGTVWRFSLETVGDHNSPRGFANLEALLDFLETALAAKAATASDSQAPRE